ncbi:MAG: hypothetical protein P1V36_17515 [Planctomycetota bacterium]|nr:hypothetical protein [Planctomycetota bacterium]
MPSPESLRRLANLTKKVRDDLRQGGMGVNFRYLFRSTAILARVVEILADHVATEAEERQALDLEAALEQATLEEAEQAATEPTEAPARPYGRERAEETA